MCGVVYSFATLNMLQGVMTRPITAHFFRASATIVPPGTNEAIGNPQVISMGYVESVLGGRERRPIYWVSVMFDDEFSINVPAMEMATGIPGVECVIGRDILRHGTFTYDGKADSFALSF